MNHRSSQWAPDPNARPSSAAAPSKGNNAPSVAERIAAELRDEILRGRYQSGDRLPSERDLAEHFGAHRGAIREALKKLEQLGIAEIKPGGVRAAPIETASLDIVPHLIELDPPHNAELFGQVLEMFGGVLSLAARLAAERASDSQRKEAIVILEQLMDEKIPPAEEEKLIHPKFALRIEAPPSFFSPINHVLRHVHSCLGLAIRNTESQMSRIFSPSLYVFPDLYPSLFRLGTQPLVSTLRN